MSEILLMLLQLINDGKTINEISQLLKLSNREIYSYLTELKNKGFDFERKYYYCGDIVYVPKKTFFDTRYNITNLYTTPQDKEIKVLIISDLHLGNEHERKDYIEKIFDYCVKEGINIILCAGDFIDGMLSGNGKKIHENILEQIEYVIENYPFDKNILTFTILGNHDISTLNKLGLDFAKVLENYRHDIISLGYGKGELHIKNDKIILRHSLSRTKLPNPTIVPPAIIIQGHSHEMHIKHTESNLLIITVPSLSGFKNNGFIPGFIEATFCFSEGIIKKGYLEQFIILDDNHIIKVNESEHYVGRYKERKDTIALEESKEKKLTLTPQRNFSQRCKITNEYTGPIYNKNSR